MFRVQTEKERIDQAYREKVVVLPPRSGPRYGSGPGPRSGSRSGSGSGSRAQGRGGAFSASPGLKGSSNAAREARLSRFSNAHLPQNRGGIERRSETPPPQAIFRGAGQKGSRGASPSGRGSKHRGSGGASPSGRGSKQRGPGGGASRTSRRGSKQRGSGGGATRSSSKRRN